MYGKGPGEVGPANVEYSEDPNELICMQSLPSSLIMPEVNPTYQRPGRFIT